MRERNTGYAGCLDVEDLVRPSDGDVMAEGHEAPFLRALEQFTESLNSEARLTPAGVTAVRSRIRTSLALQARMSLVRQPPSAALDAPVFITGMPGSGAALLHNVLAEHPGVDAPSLWELADPVAGAKTPGERRALITRGRAHALSARRATAGRAVGQFREATRPGSCHWLLANTFLSPALSIAYRVPGYAAWLESRDLVPAYGFHRLQLQAVFNRLSGGIPVLRDPFHAPHLRDLVRVYPRARVVRVHRDPADVLAATAGIAWSQRRVGSAAVDPAEVGTEWAARLERHFAHAEVARAEVGDASVLDVRHADLVGDPVGTLRQVAGFIGVPSVPAVERNVLELVGDAGVAARGARRFEPEEFGFSRRRIGFRFAGYRKTYGV
ncbi:sulfotransferase family protein [Streptomyces sp. NPDC059979]|uniref:sulfotransferase family protein n=1 Tax=Streptomyces sp. NPDC059979 TaxID=3347021 RepID=UPI0036AA0015